jgi:porin
MMKHSVILTGLMILAYMVNAQEKSGSVESPIQFEASYIGDNINNLTGGIKRGSAYLGFANFFISIDMEKAKLWKGGEFHIHAANTHGANPSADLIGDFQVISNIEAGNHSYLQEFWYKQNIGKLELTFGLQDLNVEIANTEGGALYLNSSFGILPSISANLSSPIFPLTALGLTTKLNINEKSSLLIAIYDGNPTEFENNPYNLNWQYNSGDGILAVTEFQQITEISSLPGKYKLGIFNYNHISDQVLKEDIPDSLNFTITGGYLMVDQKIWQSGNRSSGVFSQAGISPTKYSINNYYLGAGLNYYGLFNKKGEDALGLAIAHVHFNDDLGSETTVELTYFNQITENIFIQPDIQYIVTPSGKNSLLENAFTANIRFGFSF